MFARVRHFLRFAPRHILSPRHCGGTALLPSACALGVCVFVRVRVHICVLEKEETCWTTKRFRPEEAFFIRACRGDSYANNLF